MSIPKISGREARELLDETVDGPWRVEVQMGTDLIVDPSGYAVAYNEDEPDVGRPNSELLAAAPSLAETVAWLYDRIREIHNDQRCWADAYRAPIEWDPESTDPARLARAEAHDDCADMLATLLDDGEDRP